MITMTSAFLMIDLVGINTDRYNNGAVIVFFPIIVGVMIFFLVLLISFSGVCY